VLAASAMLQRDAPDLRIRVVNVTGILFLIFVFDLPPFYRIQKKIIKKRGVI